MDERDRGRSRELDVVRELLFPHLSRDEGWERIEAADEGQRDEERWSRIERFARLEDALADAADR
jgi:hypothetical protein